MTAHRNKKILAPLGAFLFFILLLFLPALAFSASQWSGKVVAITDGDTIKVLKGGKAVKVRIWGIDCPEKGQPFGKAAKQAASDLVYRQTVTIREVDTDRWGRTVADVILSDGRDFGQEMVAQGLAWWFQKYAPKDTVLEHLEAEARDAKRGLWADEGAEPPWEWRKR